MLERSRSVAEETLREWRPARRTLMSVARLLTRPRVRATPLVLAATLLLALTYVPMVARYPVPFEPRAFWLNTYFHGLHLRSTFLRLPGDLPGLAVPRTSAPVNGRDYAYTSQNNLLYIAVSAVAQAVSGLFRLDDPFHFAVFMRCFALALSLGALLVFYAVFRAAYGDAFRAAIVALAVGGGWALYFTADVLRWAVMMNALVALVCYGYIRVIATGSRAWRRGVCALLFGLGALDYVSALFALGMAAAIWARERRIWPPAPMAAAVCGTVVLLGAVIVGSVGYEQHTRASTGVGAIIHYLSMHPRWLIRSVMTSVGADAFYPPLHAWLPLTLGDVTNVLVPPLPSVLRGFDVAPAQTAPHSAFDLYQRMLGFEPFWWSATTLPRSLLIAAAGAALQAVALTALVWWWFGAVRRPLRTMWRAGSPALGSLGDARVFLRRVAIWNLIIYLFLIYQVSVEGTFRVGILSVAVAVGVAEVLTRVPLTEWARVRLAAYVVVLIGLNVWHAVDVKLVAPRAHPYYAGYVALIEWARGASHGQPLYFDLPFDHIPAKLMIDGPMPYACLAVPRFRDYASCRDFRTVYGERGQDVLIVGIGKTRRERDEVDAPKLRRGDVVRWAQLGHEPLETSLRGFLPERPDVRIRLDYVHRVTLGAGEDVYFYGGAIVPDGGTGA